MPFFSHIEDELDLHYVRVEGDVDLEDVIRFQDELIGKATETEGMDALYDLSAVERLDVTREGIADIRERSRLRREIAAPGRLAIVAPTDLSFGLARMYVMMAERADEPRELAVFRDRGEAASWLGLPEGWTPPVDG